jgi:anti-sigma B factor antagonist
MEVVLAATPNPPAPELRIEIETTMDRINVRCSGRITSTSVKLLLTTVRPLILQTKRIALNLADLRYVDSSGLGALVQLWAAAKQAGTELTAINLNKRIQDLFGLTSLSSFFEGQ